MRGTLKLCPFELPRIVARQRNYENWPGRGSIRAVASWPGASTNYRSAPDRHESSKVRRESYARSITKVCATSRDAVFPRIDHWSRS